MAWWKSCSIRYSDRPMKRSKEEWLRILETIEGGYVPFSGKASIYDDSFRSAQDLREKGVITNGDRILDIGCANGNHALAFAEEMDVEYVGVDCTEAAIRFCSRAFEEYPHFSFVHLDIRNPQYNQSGTLLPTVENIVLPDGPFDVVIARSLFTHLETPSVCALYIAEVERVLKSGGKFYSTWFRHPPHPLSSAAGKTVLREAEIMNLLKNFHIDETVDAGSNEYHTQWIMYTTYAPSFIAHKKIPVLRPGNFTVSRSDIAFGICPEFHAS